MFSSSLRDMLVDRDYSLDPFKQRQNCKNSQGKQSTAGKFDQNLFDQTVINKSVNCGHNQQQIRDRGEN